MMKNNKIILITIAVILITVGIGASFITKLGDKDKLITCNHGDKNIDMICDSCGFSLSFADFVEYKKIGATEKSSDEKIEISGLLPKESKVEISKVNREEAISLAKSYETKVSIEEVVDAFDITIKNEDVKYQPKEYGQTVNVKLSNLDVNLDSSKTYALLHIMDDGKYEMLPISKITAEEIEFKASSFSTYIIVRVNAKSITFDGANIKVFDLDGNEITDGTMVADSTYFAFKIIPLGTYGISNVSCVFSSGDNAIEVVGSIKNKSCIIPEVTENLTVYVETVLPPTITVHPTSPKVVVGSDVTLTITAEGATTYQWQYRENNESSWKISPSTTNNYTFTTANSMKGYQYRCLIEDEYFNASNAIPSDVATVSYVGGSELSAKAAVTGLQIVGHPETQKVAAGNVATFTIETKYADTFRWQYKSETDGLWYDIDSSMASGYNTAYLQFDTSSMTQDSNLSGLQVRCIVSHSDEPDNTLTSDPAILVVVQGASKTNVYIEACELMGRENVDYMLGAYRANNSTTYTADLVTKVILATEAPTGATTSWDVSATENAGEIISYIVPSTTIGGKQCYDQYLVSQSIKMNAANCVKLFKGYTNMTAIENIGYLRTAGATDMYAMFYSCESLKTLDLNSFDTSAVTDMCTMFDSCYSLTSLNVTSFDTSAVTDMGGMFQSCYALESIDVSNFVTSAVTDMSGMFNQCESLTVLNVSKFDTSNVKYMCMMFGDLGATSLDLSNFNTSKVIDMSFMFYMNSTVRYLNLSSFDTSAVTTMEEMFSRCTGLNVVVFSDNFEFVGTNHYFDNTETYSVGGNWIKVYELEGTETNDTTPYTATQVSTFNSTTTPTLSGLWTRFEPEDAYATIVYDANSVGTFSNGSTQNVVVYSDAETVSNGTYEEPVDTNTNTVFTGWYTDAACTDGNEFDIATAAGEMTVYAKFEAPIASGICGGCSWIIYPDGTLKIYPTNGVSGTLESHTSASQWHWYSYVNSITNIVIEDGVIGNTSLACMFYGCSKATKIDLSGLDTTNVTNMSNMFGYCNKVENLDFSKFNTKKVTNMSGMFYYCQTLTSLDLTSFDTTNVSDMGVMFYACGANTIDLSSFNTTNLRNMLGMFSYSRVQTLDLSNFTTTNVQSMAQMFDCAGALTSVNLNSFDTSNVTSMSWMFRYCTSLTELNLSNFDTKNVQYMDAMFGGCYALTTLDLSSFNTQNVTTMNGMFYGCNNLITLNVSSFNTSKVTNMYQMFAGCTKLNLLDLSGFDTTKVTNMNDMFYDVNKLWNIKLGENFNFVGDWHRFNNYSYGVGGTNWVKAYDVNGEATNDYTNYTATQISALTSDTTPVLAGTWARLTYCEVICVNTNGEYIYKDANGQIVASYYESVPYGTTQIINPPSISRYISPEPQEIYCDSTNKVTFIYEADSRVPQAIYSADDGSLTFVYEDMLSVDDTYGGKTITAVYTGFETDNYVSQGNTPWNSYKDLVTKVIVQDEIIPTLTNCWFKGFANCTEMDLSNLNMSDVTSMTNMFYGANKLEKIALNDTFKFVGTDHNFNSLANGVGGSWIKIVNSDGMATNDSTPYTATQVSALNNADTTPILAGTWERLNTSDAYAVITYDVNGNGTFSNGKNQNTVIYDDAATIRNGSYEEPVPTSADTVFTGWYTDVNCTDGNEFDLATASGEMTVYAKYQAILGSGVLDGVSWIIYDDGLLRIYPTNGFSGTMTSNTESSSTFWPWIAYKNEVKKVVVDEGVHANTNASWMFSVLYYCKEMDLSNLDVSAVTDMTRMFSQTGYYATTFDLDLTNWDVSSVTSMESIFLQIAYKAESFDLDLTGWDVSNVQNMKYMFQKAGYSATTWNVDGLENWKTSSATDMAYIFSYTGYSATEYSLDLTEWDTPVVTSMEGMFWNTGYSAKKFILKGLDSLETTGVTNMKYMFQGAGHGATTFNLIGIENLDTSAVINMDSMFVQAAYSVQDFNLDLSSWDVSNVQNMKYMFQKAGYSASTWNVYGLENWKTSAAIDMGYVFSYTGYSATEYTLDLTGWDTSAATSMEGMFWNTGYSAKKFILKGLDSLETTGVTNMKYMFQNAGYSATLWNVDNISNWDVSSVESMDLMFCYTGYSATTFELDLSGWNTSAVTSMNKMFYGCTNLYKITFGGNFAFVGTNHYFDNTATYGVGDRWKKTHNIDGTATNDSTTYTAATVSTLTSSTTPTLAGTWERDYPQLMARENSDYMLGAYRANNSTTYTDNLVTKVIFTNETPDDVVSSWDVSANEDGSIMSHIVASTEVNGVQYYDQYIVANKKIKASNCYQLFRGYSSMTEIENLSYMMTSDVTDMSYMFYYCEKLTTVDVSGFDTSDVTNMSYMFYYCFVLPTVDVSGFNTTNVTDMSYMFNYCKKLTTADVSGFDTTNVTNMSYMFHYCNKLATLDVSGFNTSKVTDMSSMFGYCYALTNLDVSNFDTTNVTDMSMMFDWDYNLQALDVSGFNTSKVTDMFHMFYLCSGLTSLDVSNFDTANVTDMGYMFARCEKLTTIDVTGFVTTSLTDMTGMFKECIGLTSIDVTGFDTTNVTSMKELFSYCKSLTTIDVTKFVTTKVTNMSSMFYGCSGLVDLDVSKFDTTNVTNMSYMFRECMKLSEIDVSNFITTNVTNMSWMFGYCKNLTTLNLKSFKTTKVTDMSYMFYSSKKLRNLDLSTFSTLKSPSMNNMFASCTNLESLILGENFGKLNGTKMFEGTSNLERVISMKSTTLASLILTAVDTNCLGELPTRVLYVPDTTTEALYEADATYAALLGADRIKPFLELKGESTIVWPRLVDYSDQGVTVAGWEEHQSSIYNGLGYTVTTTGLPINIFSTGTSTITYTLTYTNSYGTVKTLDTLTRTVKVEDKLRLMGRDNVDYMLGAYRDDSATTYKANLVTKIIFASEAPANPADSWDVSTASAGNITSYIVPSIMSGDTQMYDQYIVAASSVNASDCYQLFRGYTNMTKIENIEYMTTIGSYNMYSMFYECYKLTELDLSNFDTSTVTDMSQMFRYCTSLTTLDLSSFDTSKVTLMSFMFANCDKLTSIDVSKFNTSKVTTMFCMFDRCYSLLSLDLSNFDTSSVINMEQMFGNCSSLTLLDLSSFDTSNVKRMGFMFSKCSGLTSLDISNFNTSSVTSLNSMFYNCSSLTSLDLSHFDTSNVKNTGERETGIMTYMFCNCKNLTFLDVSSFDTSSVTSMYSMFRGCSSLTSLDVSNFDTSSVTTMYGMFFGCSSLTSLDLSSFDTSSVTIMSSMFENCTNLTSLNLKNFNTSLTTNIHWMFANCSNLIDLDLSSFDTSNVTTMKHMFYNCSSLTSLDLSGFDTSSVTLMSFMFENCNSLTSLDLSNFDTNSVTNMENMFVNCYELETLLLGENFDKLYGNNMFEYDSKLERIVSLRAATSASDVMSLSGDVFNGLDSSAVLYVPNAATEALYEADAIYMSLLGADRIEPIMALVGNNPVAVPLNSTYDANTDLGVTVANWFELSSDEYTSLGFTTETAGLPVDTSAEGEKTVTYTLNHTNASGETTLLDTQTRSVKVTKSAELMARDNNDFMLGAYTADNNTTYASNLVTKVIFADEAPANTKASWDVSANADGSIMSHIVPSILSGDGIQYYDQYLVADSMINAEICSNLFANYKSMTEIENIEKMTTIGVSQMYAMFSNCYNLRELDVTHLDTSAATNMNHMFNSCYALKSIDLSNFDTSNVRYMSFMFAHCKKLTELDVSSFNTMSVTTMNSMFTGCTSLLSLDLSNFNTSQVTTMSNMFDDSFKLVTLNVSSFDTTKVTNMYMMFDDCYALTSLDVSGFNTSQVTNMGNMFRNCKLLSNIDVSGFNTSQVTNMSRMFVNCSSVTTLDVSEFDTSKVTDMHRMFETCTKITELDLSNFNTAHVTTMEGMFANDTLLTEIIFGNDFEFVGENHCFSNTEYYYEEHNTTFKGVGGNWIKSANIDGSATNDSTVYTATEISALNNTDTTPVLAGTWTKDSVGKGVLDGVSWIIYPSGQLRIYPTNGVSGQMTSNTADINEFWPWNQHSGDVTSVTIDEGVIAGESVRGLFNDLKYAKTFDVGNLDISKTTNISRMFRNCAAVETITGLDKWNTSNVTNMDYVFGSYTNHDKTNLKELDLSSWDTSKVTNMGAMFQLCTGLESLNLSGWDTSKVTDMGYMFNKCRSLTSLNVSHFNTENVTDMMYMFALCENLTEIDVSNFNTQNVTNISYMFRECYLLKNMDISNFNTSNVTDMKCLFYQCYALETINLGELDTSNVTDMGWVFYRCESVKSLDLSSWDTSKVTNMKSMINQCHQLTEIDLSNFNTEKVENMTYMFSGSDKLETINVSSFKTTSVTDMRYMFNNCPAVTKLDLSGFDTRKVTNMDYMFCLDKSLNEITFGENFAFSGDNHYFINGDVNNTVGGNWAKVYDIIGNYLSDETLYTATEVSSFTASTEPTLAGTWRRFYTVESGELDGVSWEITSLGKLRIYPTNGVSGTMTGNDEAKEDFWPWYAHSGDVMNVVVESGVNGIRNSGVYLFNGLSNARTIDVSGLNTNAIVGMQYMFKDCSSVKNLDLSTFNTSAALKMYWMFAGCRSLTTLDISTFTTNLVSDMSYMFAHCENLKNLNLSHFNTSNVEYMNSMFDYCYSLTTLDISSFDTTKVVSMNGMFGYCYELTSLDISHFKTENVTDMYRMFIDCKALTELNVSNFNTEKVENMGYMFCGCTDLTTLDVSNFNTSNVKSMDSTFRRLEGLTTLDISNLNTGNVTKMANMFYGSKNLTSINFGEKFDTSKVENMENMFRECHGLLTLDVSNFETSSVTNMSNMFNGCRTLKTLDVTNFDTSNVTDMFGMFAWCDNLTTLDLSNFDTRNVTEDMGEMFSWCYKLDTLVLGDNFDRFINDKYVIFRETPLKRIISLRTATTASDLITLSGDVFEGLDTSAILYVPNATAEALYEANSVYASELGAARIEPIMSIVGNNPSIAAVGVEYTDKGVAITDWTNDESGDYTSLGFSVTTEGMPVDTSVVGERAINYTLKYTNTSDETTSLDTQTRTIKVTGVASLMERDNVDYMLGAYRANEATTYKAEQVTKVIFTTDAPTGVTASWDVSETNGANQITSYIVPSVLSGDGVQYYDQYIVSNKTINAQYCRFLFRNYKNMTEIENFEDITTECASDMYGMFALCNSLTKLDVSSFDTSEVTNMGQMFRECILLPNIDISNFETSEVITMHSMFWNCANIEEIKGIESLNTSKVTEMSYMFGSTTGYEKTKLKSLDLSGWDTSSLKNMYVMFQNCTGLESLNLAGWNTSNITDLRYTFTYCSSLKELDLSSFNTKNVTDMKYMFSNCKSLINLNLSSFDTSKVTNMGSMFAQCTNAEFIDVSSFNTSNVTRMDGMFWHCESIEEIDVSNFDTSSAIYMASMFSNCHSLKTLDVSNFDTSALKGLESSYHWIEDNVKLVDVDGIFYECRSLKTLVLGEKFGRMDGRNIFWGTENLERVISLKNVTSADEILPFTDNNGLGESGDPTLYVINPSVEALYEADELYAEKLGADRIQPLMELVGNNPTKVPVGATYNDLGVSVAGWYEVSADEYTNIGLDVVTTGLPVDTSVEADKELTYTLNYTNDFGDTTAFDTLTRTVEVKDMVELMGRDNIDYMLGAYRANNSTTYEAELVTKVIFADEAPAESTASWDVSANEDGSIMSHIVPSVLSGDGVQYYDQYIVSEKFINAKNCRRLFSQYRNMTSIENLESITTVGATDMSMMFYTCKNLVDVDLTNFDTSLVTDMSYMFQVCNKLVSLDLSSFNTENVTDMKYMFSKCNSLINVDLSSFNTSKVESLSSLFNECSSLINVDLSSFNTSNVQSLYSLFNSCSALTSVDLSNFDTSNVTNMYRVFSFCSSLENVDVSSFNTSKVINMGSMFSGCEKLASIDVSSFDTSKVTKIDGMFASCAGLTELDVTNFNTSSVECMSLMFAGCSSLKVLDLSNFDTSALNGSKSDYYWTDDDVTCANADGLLNNDYALETVILGKNIDSLAERSIFDSTFALTRIISLRPATSAEEIMSVSLNNYLDETDDKVLYVPNSTTEALYEADETYMSLLGADRIKSIMEMNGDNPDNVPVEKTYNDPGVTVASWDNSSSSEYTSLGLSVETTGLPVDTSVEGETTVTYTLKHTNASGDVTVLDTQTRTVKVVDANRLMERESYEYIDGEMIYYAIGASRADKATYTADLIKTITLVDSPVVPADALDYWDASYTIGDEQIMAWVKENPDDPFMYDLYLGGDKAILAPANSQKLFAEYTNCTTISGLELLNTGRVTDMWEIFQNNINLRYLDTDIAKWDVTQVEDLRYAFNNCEIVQNIDLSGWTTTNLKHVESMFENCIELTSLKLNNFKVDNVTNMSYMFYECNNLNELVFTGWKTGNVTDMSAMFYNCYSLTSLDLSGWDVSKVIYMDSMFALNNGLTSLKLTNWNPVELQSAEYMFESCENLTSLDLNNWKVSKLVSTMYMFYDCSAASSINVTGWDTSSLEMTTSMFEGCKNLRTIDVTSWDISNVYYAEYMFYDCSSLEIINLTSWNTAVLEAMEFMFGNCSNLEILQLGKQFTWLDGTPIDGEEGLFTGCGKLKAIITERQITDSDDAIVLNTNTGIKELPNAILYVLDPISEEKYEEAENYAQEFGANRIKPILELQGEARVAIMPGETYTDAGVTVAGLTAMNSSIYAGLGYTVNSVSNVRENVSGTYEVTWTIYKPSTNALMSVTREVYVRYILTAPLITVRQSGKDITTGKWANGDVVVTISGSTYENGEIEYIYSLDGSNWQAGNTFNFDKETLSTTIYAKARGKVESGDISSESTFEIKLDKTVPQITSHERVRYEGTKEVVKLDVYDGAISSGIEAYAISSTNNVTTATWQTNEEIIIPDNGTWYVWTRDNAGNVSVSYTIQATEKITVEATYGATVEMYVDAEVALQELEVKGVTEATIKLLEDNIISLRSDQFILNSGLNYVFDMNGKDLIIKGGEVNIYGKLTIINDEADMSYFMTCEDSINLYNNPTDININSGAELTVNGNVNLYCDDTCDLERGATVEVSTNGTLNLIEGIIETSYETAAINNNGTTIITGGTVISSSTMCATIGNLGTLTIGSNDATVSTDTPVISGVYMVVSNSGTLNFYDGRLISTNKTEILYGEATSIANGYHLFEEETDTTKEMYLVKNDTTWVEYWDISETAGVDNVFAGLQVVSGNGISEDTRYKLVVGGTGRAKRFEIVDTYDGDANHPWYEKYRNTIIELNLEEGVTSYGAYMFFNLNQVTSIEFPDSLTQLGMYACHWMSSLTGNVNIGKNLTDVGLNPFKMTNVTSFTVDSDNTVYEVSNEGLYNVNTKTLVSYPCGSSTTESVVTDGTLIIGNYAFNGAQNLKTVILPETVQKICIGAFERVYNLEEITIPQNVNYIEHYAFGLSDKLKYVYLKPTEFESFDTNSTFKNMAPNSIIYTESKEIADLFIADTTYTAANTKVYYPFAITSELADEEIARGATLTIVPTIEAGYIADDVSYQWYKDGVAIAGATSATYTKASFTDSDVGAYKLVIRSAMQENGEYYYTVESNVASITLGDFDGPEEINSAINYNDDGSATITITAKDKETGVEEILVNDENLDINKNEEEGIATGSFDITESGDYVVKAIDGAGNESEITITAYEIIYAANSDSYTGETKSQIKIKDADIRIRENGYVKVGHEFTSWNTSEDETGTVYNANDLYTANANVTLYATWSVKQYVVRFYNNNGINGDQLVSEATYTYGATITVPEEQYKTATEINGDKYRIFYHDNNWTGVKKDVNGVESVVNITDANKTNITMIDSNVDYHATYTYTDFNMTESTVRLEGNTIITAGTIGIDNIEGLVILGENSSDTSRPTIQGATAINNDNGLVLWYNANFIGPVKGLIVEK